MPTLAGQFLVARPVLLDPNFRQSVVLLLEHGAEGAFGLVINRPRDVQGMSFTIFSGGPCQAQGLLMLHGHDDWAADHPTKTVAPGVYIGDAQCLKKINDVGDDDAPDSKRCGRSGGNTGAALDAAVTRGLLGACAAAATEALAALDSRLSGRGRRRICSRVSGPARYESTQRV